MRAVLSVGLLSVVVLHVGAGDLARDDQGKLQGFWRVVQSIDEGVETPQEGEEATVVIFDSNIIKVREGDKSHDLFQYRLFPDKAPKGIDLRLLHGKRRGEVNEGIYQLEEKTLRICVQEGRGKERPKAFESKKGTGLKLIVLRKL